MDCTMWLGILFKVKERRARVLKKILFDYLQTKNNALDIDTLIADY